MQSLNDYFRSQQVSLQWAPVLRALAVQALKQLDARAAEQLFAATGAQMAQDLAAEFEGINQLTELTAALNEVWAHMNWGWVDLADSPNGIKINHHYPPTISAFGTANQVLGDRLLAGFYEGVFRQQGASERMRVIPLESEPDRVELILSRGV